MTSSSTSCSLQPMCAHGIGLGLATVKEAHGRTRPPAPTSDIIHHVMAITCKVFPCAPSKEAQEFTITLDKENP